MAKQINNFAKVIPLDSNGNPVVDSIKREEYVIKDIKKKEVNPRAKLYIVIILLLLALNIGFIILYVLPRIK